MGLFSGIKKLAGGAAGFLGKAAGFLQNPLSLITEPLKKMVGGLLDKLPFGIGNMIKPFVNQFIDSAASMLMGGPLAGIAGGLTKLAGTVKELGDLAETIAKKAEQLGALEPQEAVENFQNIIAEGHARLLTRES